MDNNNGTSSASFYNALPKPDSIRLLELEPSTSPEAELRGRLTLTTIREREADIIKGYTAISYVWGDPTPKGSIILDGKSFPLTASLDAALRGVRDESAVCRVWADALCINQADVKERNQQVRLMGSIYSLADHTVIDLGPLTPEAECVLRAANDSNSFFSPLGSYGRLRDILERPWFTRTWILQELVLSRDPLVQCGRLRTRWTRLCSLLVDAAATMQKGELMTRVIRDMEATRAQFHKRRDITMVELLSARRGMGVKDPRDMVYALLGMLGETAIDALPYGFVDYSLSVEQVYIQTARHIVESGLRFGVQEWSTLQMLLSAADDGVPVGRRPRSLPSWVPDWRLARDMQPLPATYPGGDTVRTDPGPGANHVHPPVDWCAVVDDSPILVCLSQRLFLTVEAVGPVFPPPSALPSELVERCRLALDRLLGLEGWGSNQAVTAKYFSKTLFSLCSAALHTPPNDEIVAELALLDCDEDLGQKTSDGLWNIDWWNDIGRMRMRGIPIPFPGSSQGPQLPRDGESDSPQDLHERMASVLSRWIDRQDRRLLQSDPFLQMIRTYVNWKGVASPLQGRRLALLRQTSLLELGGKGHSVIGVVPCRTRPDDQCFALLSSPSMYVVREEDGGPDRAAWEEAILRKAHGLLASRAPSSAKLRRAKPAAIGTWGRLIGECYVTMRREMDDSAVRDRFSTPHVVAIM